MTCLVLHLFITQPQRRSGLDEEERKKRKKKKPLGAATSVRKCLRVNVNLAPGDEPQTGIFFSWTLQ